MHPSVDLGILEEKFKVLGRYKTAIFRLILVKQKDSDNWGFYYGSISLRIADINVPYNESYNDGNIIIAEFSSNSEQAHLLMLLMKEKDVYFINGPLSIININSNISSIYEYPGWSDITRETFNMDFPAEEIRLTLSNTPKTNHLKLVRYRDIHELIESKIGIDLNKHNGLPNTLSFFFEKEHGRIVNFKFKKGIRQLLVTFDYDENELDKYSILLFLDKYGQQKIREEIPLNKSIKKSLHFIPDNIEIRLIYEDTLVDVWREIIEKDGVDDEATPTTFLNYLDLTEWKGKVDKLKGTIEFPESVQFGVLVEKKLNDAEKLDDAESILQKCAEAMEQLCKDFCSVFGIGIKDSDGRENGTLKIHRKLTDYWREKTGLNMTELRHQPGLRHLVVTCDLKKHKSEEYTPSLLESQYCLLLSWRAYFGILKMIAEIKKKQLVAK